jgi:cell division protein FtsZ
MVTYPFALERARVVKAEEGINKLRNTADSVIILDNNRLVQIVPNLPMNQAFLVSDEILAKAIGGLVFTITQPSLVNIDFADVRSIMGQGDVGMIAVGSGKGPNKVDDAVEGVMKNRLLDVDFAGAKGALIHIAGGADLTLGDAIRAGERITETMDAKASVKWGARLLPDFDGKLEIVAIVTGVTSANIVGRDFAKNKSAEKEIGYDIEIIG